MADVSANARNTKDLHVVAIVPIRWYDKRGSRMRASPGLAARVAWDLLRIPLIHRASGRGAASRT